MAVRQIGMEMTVPHILIPGAGGMTTTISPPMQCAAYVVVVMVFRRRILGSSLVLDAMQMRHG
jgi:hypothetical protein